MPEYGLTNKGVNIKRLDVILKEMQADLSAKWGVNVAQNQKSFLNVLLTNIADHLAELWEMGQDVYNSQYPLTAEGMYLDGIGQFVGIWRETEAPSYYHILCTGVEGTNIPKDTLIATDTNPPIYLNPIKESTLSRANFNTALVKVVSFDGTALSVIINGTLYTYTPGINDTQADATAALANLIGNGFFGAVDEETGYLRITASETVSINTLSLSENLTTETIGCIITFATQDNGDIYIPAGVINQIIKSAAGLESVENVGTYISGRLQESDAEFRDSYIKKIFTHSSRMANSIRSAILTSVQGVKSCVVYENPTNIVDDQGRYPHSVEVVCEGGDETEIAQQILSTKAGGISTYGDTAVDITTSEEDTITIRFNRPTEKFVWFRVVVTKAANATLQSGYEDVIRDIILEAIDNLDSGEDLRPQGMVMSQIYDSIPGIAYVDITMAEGVDNRNMPQNITDRIIYVGIRERVCVESGMIIVTMPS